MSNDPYLRYELAGWVKPSQCQGCEFTERSCIISKGCPVHGTKSADPVMNLPPIRVVMEECQ